MKLIQKSTKESRETDYLEEKKKSCVELTTVAKQSHVVRGLISCEEDWALCVLISCRPRTVSAMHGGARNHESALFSPETTVSGSAPPPPIMHKVVKISRGRNPEKTLELLPSSSSSS